MTATTPTTTRRTLVILVLGALALTAGLTAQSKPAITRADYGQWETLAVGGGGRGGGGGGFSPDGQWIAYGINRTSRSNELRVTKIADASTKTFAFGGGQTFSFDSKWLAYSITQSEAEQERLRAANRPVQNSLGILNLSTGESTTVEGIESFAFSGDGKYLAMRRYQPAPPAPAAGGGANAPAGGRGGRGGGGGDSDRGPAGCDLDRARSRQRPRHDLRQRRPSSLGRTPIARTCSR